MWDYQKELAAEFLGSESKIGAANVGYPPTRGIAIGSGYEAVATKGWNWELSCVPFGNFIWCTGLFFDAQAR